MRGGKLSTGGGVDLYGGMAIIGRLFIEIGAG